MIAHQAKKLGYEALKAFRDRFQIPVSDEDISTMCRSSVSPRTAKR